MELEFLRVFVQNCLGGSSLNPHRHRQGVELHILVRLYQVGVVGWHDNGVLAQLLGLGLFADPLLAALILIHIHIHFHLFKALLVLELNSIPDINITCEEVVLGLVKLS